MSRELYAYIDGPEPVLRSDLDEALEALGWKYRLFEDMSAFRPATGKFIGSCDILAWDDALDLTDDVDTAITQRDQKAIDQLYRDDLVGTVTVDHDMPYVPDPEMLDELRLRSVDMSLIERLAHANQFYSVRTSAGRNDFSLQVQTVVGNLLGIARYGVLEDPQEGTFENFAPELVENGDECGVNQRSSTRRPWWRFW